MKRILLLTLTAAYAACSGQTVVSPDYFVETVASGFASATTMAFVDANTLLVLEKHYGRVQRLVNGVVQNVALDLPVSNLQERGLLGICLDPNFLANHFVYLYYSSSNTGMDSSTEESFQDNRVERFVYDGTNLIYSATILVIPRDPAQNNGPNHNAGVIAIGPDNKLYVTTGDLGRNRAEQNNQGAANIAAQVGGIYRLNLNGSIPSDNPFFTNPNPDFRKYYVYGLRNTFGMTFDPITGKLWYSENGPESYDEINQAIPGMNSGWTKIRGPIARSTFGIGDLVMFPGAVYKDPIFSWLEPIAPTAMLFLASNKFLPTERNQCLVADNNLGQLYLFQMNAARDDFVLTGGIADRVADSPAERDITRFGGGFGAPTDLKIGVDSYVYVLSYSPGNLYRIRPKVETLTPTSFSLARGLTISGGLQQLQSSDDDYLVLRPGIVFSASEYPVQLVVTSTSPFANPSRLTFRYESHANQNNLSQVVELFDFTNSSYVALDSRQATVTDSTVIVDVIGGSAFVNPADRTVRVRIKYKAAGPVFTYPWLISADYAAWTFTR